MKAGHFKQRLRDIMLKFKERPAMSLVIRVIKDLGENDAGDMAGSIAYYAILSIFPLLLGVIALLSLFLPSQAVQDQIFQFVSQYLPGSNQLIERNINSIIELRGTLGLFGIIGLFWTGSAIFGAIGRVINKAWDIHTYRPFYIRKLRDIAVAIGTSIIFFLSMGLTVFSSIIPVANLPILASLAIVISRLAGFILIFAMVLIMYRFMPNAKISWRNVWPAAMLAAVLFEIARSTFSVYLTNFASYDVIYGSIAVVIILLFWIYISAFIIILGAEFASEYGRLRQEIKAGRAND